MNEVITKYNEDFANVEKFDEETCFYMQLTHDEKDEYVDMLKSLRSLILNSTVTPEMKQFASQEFKILEDRRKISFKSEFPHFSELV